MNLLQSVQTMNMLGRYSDTMRIRYAILFGVSVIGGLFIPSAGTAEAETIILPPEPCHQVRETAVDWAALGETVVFRTQLSGDHASLPTGTYTLIRANGTEVALGGGGKFIDDFDPSGVLPSCEDHLAASHAGPVDAPRTQEAASRAPYSVTIRDYIRGNTIADVMSDAACLTNDQERTRLYANRPDRSDEDVYKRFWQDIRALDATQASCRDKRQIQEQFQDDPETLLRLIAIDAPLLTITRSTYFSDQVAFDPETNTLHNLFYWGC